MKIKTMVHRIVDGIVAFMGRALGLKYFPTYFNGVWLKLDPRYWNSLYTPYEPYVALALRDHLKSGSVFFDVGAHVGLWSLFGARLVGRKGAVISFEPSEAYALLSSHSHQSARIKPLNVGVGSADGEAKFFNQGPAVTNSFVRDLAMMMVRSQPEATMVERTVRIRSLDSVASELGVEPSVIKMDVEGYEYAVVSGAVGLMERFSPTWIIEVHPYQLKLSGGSEERLMTILGMHGYRVTVIDRNPNGIYTILAQVSAEEKKSQKNDALRTSL